MNLNRVMCRKATEILIGQTYDEGGDRAVKICYSLENIVDDVEKILILLVSMAWIWIFVAVLSLMLSVAPISSPQRPIYVGRARWKIKSKGILGILISFAGFCVLDNFSNYIL